MARVADDSAKKSKRGGGWVAAGCLMLFALPFAAVGAGAAGWIVYDVWKWTQVQSWVETPATLIEAGVDRHRAPKRGETIRATARYRYTFGRKEYTSDRVALYTGKDNIGSYQRDRSRELERIEAGNKRLKCYVNPETPAEAILFRDLRWGFVLFKLLFAGVFGVVGFGLLIGAALSGRENKKRQSRQEKFPDQPWMWQKEWASGRVRSNGGPAAVAASVIAALWNSISWPGFAMVWSNPENGQPYAIWIMALFPLVGTWLAVYAIMLWVRRIKWGVPEFELAAVPGVLGGPLAGVVHVPARVEPEENYTVRLACVKTVDQGSDSSKEVTLWDHEYEIDRDLNAGDRTLIPIEFMIPSDLPPSGDDVKWKLHTRATTSGVDFYAEFETPVFKTKASGDVGRDSASAATPTTAAEVDLPTVVRSMGAVLVENATSGRTIVFPMARNPGMAIFMALFATGWTGVTVFLFASDAPRIFPWVCGLFNLVLVPAALFSCFGRTRLEFGSRGVALRRGLFGLGRRREFPANQIADVYAEKSGTTWGGTEYRRVRLRTAERKQITLISEIARPRDAERLAEEIHLAVGLFKKRSVEETSRMDLDSSLPAELQGV
jgi:hypothetical protein